MSNIIPHHIGGRETLVKPHTLPVINPAYNEVIGYLNCAHRSTIDQAVSYAKQAQQNWAATPPTKRAKVLRNFGHILESRIDELAQVVTAEHGKTIADAKASIQRGLELVHYYQNIQQLLQGTFSHHVSTDVHTTSIYQPLGICAGIAPFNFPVMVPLWMLIPAIACGNAFILKASEKTPSASLKLIKWLEEAGLPPGVAQCLQGDASTVQELLNTLEIQAFTAVGSTRTAQHIYTEATRQGKRAATFGGAKNHVLVMPDADLEFTADAIVSAAFGSAGQRCMALSAIITLDDHTTQDLTSLLKAKIQKIQVGPGELPDIDMGPVISQQQLEFLKKLIQDGLNEGAKLVIDGREHSCCTIPHGFFLGPTLFSNVTPNMSIYQQELFGPILVLLQQPSLTTAMQLINEHPYGNGAVIFTQHGQAAQQFADTAQAGMIGINIPVPVPIVSHPFGGWKLSSFGAHPMHAHESIRFYSKQKSITSTWPEHGNISSFAMPHH